MAFSDFLPEATHGTTAPAGSGNPELFDFEAQPAAPGAPATGTPAPAPALPRAPDQAPLGARSPATGRRGFASLLFPGVTLEAPEPVPPRAKEPVLSRVQLVILLALLAANAWTLFVGWSAQQRLGSAPAKVADVQPVEHAAAPEATPTGTQHAPEAEHATEEAPPPRLPVIAARPEGYETLELASKAIEKGNYEHARRSLFALLCVADRLEPAVREDLTARASFLIGDAFHEQAKHAAEDGP